MSNAVSARSGLPVAAMVLYAGAGHGVSAMEIRHVGEFLEVKVQGKEPRIRAQKVAEATGTAEGSDA